MRVVSEFKNRKPVGIIHKEYSYLFFDSNGQLDPIERKKNLKLARQIIPTNSNVQGNQKIIYAKKVFKRKQFLHKYTWKPNAKVEMAIMNAIFHDKMKALKDKDRLKKFHEKTLTERRTGGDRRQLLDIYIKRRGEFELELSKERRRHSERRAGWKRISNWASIKII